MNKDTIILFAQGHIEKWNGLPEHLVLEDLVALFNAPLTTVEDVLGYYPATKYGFAGADGKEILLAYVREGKVILIETKLLPDQKMLSRLPEPDLQLPNEILLKDAYAAEYVYCRKGLVLTVAKYFNKGLPDEIVRCRGLQKMNDSKEFDSRYYRSFEDQRSW